MSSAKKYTTVGLDPEIVALIDQEALSQRRSRSFIVEQILEEYYRNMPAEGRTRKPNANQTQAL